MGQCLQKIAHSCGSGDGLQVFDNEDGNVTGYCFSCGTFVENPYGEPRQTKEIPGKQRLKKTTEEIQAEIEEIGTYPCVDLPKRRLRKDVLNHFGVRIGMSEADGTTPALRYYPYTKDGVLVGYKVKLCDQKKMWAVGNLKDVDLFGWEQAIESGAKRLIITEGEDDAVALTKIIELYNPAQYKDYAPVVVSLPHGASSAVRDITKMLEGIKERGFEVALCFDNDEPGRKAVREVCKILPNTTNIILPKKDANDCLIHGVGKAAFKAVTFKASKPKNSKLISLDEVWDSANEQAKYGVSWPWESITKQTRGIRKGETIYIGAAQKMGKSEIVNSLAVHVVTEHNWKVLLAKPEEANKKTAKLLAGKVVNTRFHDPNVEFDEDKFKKAGESLLGDKVWMIDLYQNMEWEGLKQDIIEASSIGIDAVFIDPITNLTNHMNAADANTELQSISQELAVMAMDLDLAIFIFCHLRNPDNGDPHDRGGKVLTSQFAGSRAMGRSCNYMFGLEGNKDPELPKEERNMRDLVCLADREFGESGRTKLYWDENTTQFNEVVDD